MFLNGLVRIKKHIISSFFFHLCSKYISSATRNSGEGWMKDMSRQQRNIRKFHLLGCYQTTFTSKHGTDFPTKLAFDYGSD